MNQKICFIGNSHIAALRQAIDTFEDGSWAANVSFFGSITNKVRDALVVRNGLLTSDSEIVTKGFQLTAGTGHIDLTSQDFFCVVGFGSGLSHVVTLADKYMPYSIPVKQRQPVSSGLFDHIVESWLRHTVAYQIIALLSQNTDKPLILMVNPNFSEKIVDLRRGKIFDEILDGNYQDAILATYRKAIVNVFGSKATILFQPDETVSRKVLTLDSFSTDSVRLWDPEATHRRRDFQHMNRDYGLLALRNLKDVVHKVTRDNKVVG